MLESRKNMQRVLDIMGIAIDKLEDAIAPDDKCWIGGADGGTENPVYNSLCMILNAYEELEYNFGMIDNDPEAMGVDIRVWEHA